DHPVPPGGAQPTSPWIDADAGYFATLGIPMLEGRLFTPGDTAGAPPVLLVSRAWAAHFFPEGNVVGRKLFNGGCTTCPPSVIVGVVGDVKYQGLGESPEAVYDPVTQGWPLSSYLFVRTRGGPAQAIAAVRTALRSADPNVPLDDVAPMTDRISASVSDPKMLTWLVGGFAAVALALAAIGIFGMLSYAVVTRRREIGVRMALGARSERVVSMIVGQGVRQAAIGALIGLCLAVMGTRVLAATLFGVSATDPPTLAVVTLLLIAVAIVSSWVAARRAAVIDPAEAMRAE
ncbi:MAG: FtsX-like permease family protein, partial [Gemmatimonadales bacterium]